MQVRTYIVWLILGYVCGQQSGPPTPNATKSFWLENAVFQDTRTGALPSSVDIAIIGAGFVIYTLSLLEYIHHIDPSQRYTLC